MRNDWVLVLAAIVICCAGCATPSGSDAQHSSVEPTDTALIEAAANGRARDARAILDKAPELITATDSDGFTALHLAARPGSNGVYRFEDYSATVALLIARGADVNARSEKYSMTPLHSVTSYNIPSGNLTFNGRPYQAYLREMQLRSLDLLLENGAHVNARAVKNMTPLHWAAVCGHPNMVRVLLANGADAAAQTTDGKTPLDLAREEQYSDIVELLEE